MNEKILDDIKGEVYKLHNNDKSGHGIKHIEDVISYATIIAKDTIANFDIVYLTALLHDADDYKLVGVDSEKSQTNAKRILDKYIADDKVKLKVLANISTIGYSKRLAGVTPTTVEAKIVSDADMLDAIGVSGIIRSIEYNLSKGRAFFDEKIFPKLNMSEAEYKAKNDSTVITHIFEKLLKLKDMILTKKGKELALPRHNFMVNFLYEYFTELKLDNWIKYLDEYLLKMGS